MLYLPDIDDEKLKKLDKLIEHGTPRRLDYDLDRAAAASRDVAKTRGRPPLVVTDEERTDKKMRRRLTCRKSQAKRRAQMQHEDPERWEAIKAEKREYMKAYYKRVKGETT